MQWLSLKWPDRRMSDCLLSANPPPLAAVSDLHALRLAVVGNVQDQGRAWFRRRLGGSLIGDVAIEQVEWIEFFVPRLGTTAHWPSSARVTVQMNPQSGMLPGMQPQTVRYVVYEQDGAFVAQGLDVDVASEGDTEQEAVLNLREAFELYFDAEAPVTMPPRAVRFGEIVIDA